MTWRELISDLHAKYYPQREAALNGFKRGDKIKVSYGKAGKYKRGVFMQYSSSGKYGLFRHSRTDKVLKRKAGEFEADA